MSTKPTALAAFAASQEHVELRGLSKTESGGSPNKIHGQLPLKPLAEGVGAISSQSTKPTFGGHDVLTSAVNPLTVLKKQQPGGDGQGSPARKLPSTLTPMSPLQSTEVAKNFTDSIGEQIETRSADAIGVSPRTVQATEAGSPPTTVDTIPQQLNKTDYEVVAVNANPSSSNHNGVYQKENVVVVSKPPGDGDKSDDEDFDFDDSDGEKETIKPTTQPVEDKETPPPPSKKATVDAEDLYDCPPDTTRSEQSQRQPESVSRQPKIFLPRASDIELFHVALTEDTDQLEQYLEEISPQEMLDIVDTTGRTLYHYAALSKNKLVREMIFQHVNSYHDTQFEVRLQDLMRKKAQINAWMEGNLLNGSEWVPPRVKDLQRETTKQKCTDWNSICSSVDENGRSIFHYIATTSYLISVQDGYEFCSVLRTHPNILSTKDNFKKLALHYAVEMGNVKQVKWFFQIGTKLSQADVDLLLSFNVSRVMENVILRQLEAIDMQNCYLPGSRHDLSENEDHCDPGISTFALAKLQRATDANAGRLHQLPLHRAAMFGNIRAVELLLEEGADPNARDANLWTPLHYCAVEATSKHLSIAKLLMETPILTDVNARSLKGRSPLHVAVRSRKRQLYDDSHLNEVCESKDRLSFVVYLHECKADLNLKDNHGATPLLLTCRRGDVGVAKFLLCAGCDSTATGDNLWNALHFAAIRGDHKMLSFLLSWDADSRLWLDSPGIQGRKPIDVAKNDSVRHMLANLWTECYNGNVDQVRRLLLIRSKRGSQSSGKVGDVSVKDKTAQAERTPLHLAVLGYLDVLQSPTPSCTTASPRQELLKQEKVSELKRTAPSRFLQIVVLLLQAGANMSAADKWGITPLMLAATIKDAVFMETLLERMSDENDLLVADADGNTALHYSYAFCQAQIATMLEDHIDDTDCENKQGNSPFEMTGYQDKIYPKEFRAFLKRQQDLRRRQRR